MLAFRINDAKSGQAYLLDDEGQILLASLLLISDALEPDPAALLQTRLDRDLQDCIGGHPFPAVVEHLALDLHFLGHAVEQILERDSEGALNCRNLRRRLALAPYAFAK